MSSDESSTKRSQKMVEDAFPGLSDAKRKKLAAKEELRKDAIAQRKSERLAEKPQKVSDAKREKLAAKEALRKDAISQRKQAKVVNSPPQPSRKKQKLQTNTADNKKRHFQFAQLRDTMLRKHPANKVCSPDTDIVIEGFPRSANSFAVRMLRVLQADRDSAPLLCADHTHNADNLRLAAFLGKSQLVLVRNPEDAILSAMIFSGRPVQHVARRYLRFHKKVLSLPSGKRALERRAVVDFETVVTDFNAVVARVNAITGRSIPLAEDLPALVAQVKAEVAAKEVEKGTSIRKLGTPLAERDALKAEQRAAVTTYLQAHPEIEETYRAVLALRQPV